MEYEGVFIDTLDQDEIELIALYMKKEYLRKLIAPIEKLKIRMGTKDFEALKSKKEEYDTLSKAMLDLNEEINEFKQEFNTYSY
jgi:predicted  nucleic acid-binding Zn-ribbon protein